VDKEHFQVMPGLLNTFIYDPSGPRGCIYSNVIRKNESTHHTILLLFDFNQLKRHLVRTTTCRLLLSFDLCFLPERFTHLGPGHSFHTSCYSQHNVVSCFSSGPSSSLRSVIKSKMDSGMSKCRGQTKPPGSHQRSFQGCC